MTKEFIPYNQALFLKDLGFDEPCMAWYDTRKPDVSLNTSHYHSGKWNYLENAVSLPLYQQAFRWFREKYNIHAEITWSPSYEYDSGEWSDAIYEITFVDVSYTKELKAESPDMQRSNGKQLTYEGAQLECLNMLIEIVNNKTNR